jgi:hypothetical protein
MDVLAVALVMDVLAVALVMDVLAVAPVVGVLAEKTVMGHLVDALVVGVPADKDKCEVDCAHSIDDCEVPGMLWAPCLACARHGWSRPQDVPVPICRQSLEGRGRKPAGASRLRRRSP